jgi:hypothetical protein
VYTFEQLEQSKIYDLTFILVGIATLTAHYDLLVRVGFMQDPGDVLRQTSPHDISGEEFSFNIDQI